MITAQDMKTNERRGFLHYGREHVYYARQGRMARVAWDHGGAALSATATAIAAERLRALRAQLEHITLGSECVFRAVRAVQMPSAQTPNAPGIAHLNCGHRRLIGRGTAAALAGDVWSDEAQAAEGWVDEPRGPGELPTALLLCPACCRRADDASRALQAARARAEVVYPNLWGPGTGGDS